MKPKSTSKVLPLDVIPKPVLTTLDAITHLCTEANASSKCAGIVAWMRTFSPAKMWLCGLRILAKPVLHLHTQFNRDLSWDSIDMDFMNLNQSAHGDREFGYMAAREAFRAVAVFPYPRRAQTATSELFGSAFRPRTT